MTKYIFAFKALFTKKAAAFAAAYSFSTNN